MSVASQLPVATVPTAGGERRWRRRVSRTHRCIGVKTRAASNVETPKSQPNVGVDDGDSYADNDGLGLTFLVHRVKSISKASAKPVFDGIYKQFPRDQYVDIGRYRTFSDLLYFPSSSGDDQVRVVAEGEDPFATLFVPPEEYKSVNRKGQAEEAAVPGNKTRKFDPLPDELVELPQFKDYLRRFIQYCKLNDEFNFNRAFRLGCHAIRIVADPDVEGDTGEVAPEGIHQDGFTYIGILATYRENAAGGDLLVHMPREDGSGPLKDPVFSNKLRPGDFIFLNDRSIWHDATQVIPADGKNRGVVDYLVLTLDGTLNRPIMPWELHKQNDAAPASGGRGPR